MPVRWAEYDPKNTNRVFLATELGVWSANTINVGYPIWDSTYGGIPHVRTTMLQIRSMDSTIVAATFGRGVFTAALAPTPITAIVPVHRDISFEVYPNPTSSYLNVVGLDGNTKTGMILDTKGAATSIPLEPTADSGILKVNVEHLPSGIYFLRIPSGNGINQARFVKK
jgi:hypothetical protein